MDYKKAKELKDMIETSEYIDFGGAIEIEDNAFELIVAWIDTYASELKK